MGAGLAYTFNYERVLMYGIAARIGIGYWAVKVTAGTATAKASYLTVPIAVNYIGISRGPHGLEVGAGATLFYVSAAGSSMGTSASAAGMTAWGNFNIGYRFHPRRMGFQFRIGFQLLYAPGLGFSNDNPAAFGVLPWGYISVGFTI